MVGLSFTGALLSRLRISRHRRIEMMDDLPPPPPPYPVGFFGLPSELRDLIYAAYVEQLPPLSTACSSRSIPRTQLVPIAQVYWLVRHEVFDHHFTSRTLEVCLYSPEDWTTAQEMLRQWHASGCRFKSVVFRGSYDSRRDTWSMSVRCVRREECYEVATEGSMPKIEMFVESHRLFTATVEDMVCKALAPRLPPVDHALDPLAIIKAGELLDALVERRQAYLARVGNLVDIVDLSLHPARERMSLSAPMLTLAWVMFQQQHQHPPGHAV